VTPVEDFERMIGKAGDIYLILTSFFKGEMDDFNAQTTLITSATIQLQHIIHSLITLGKSDAHYRKSLNCLKIYKMFSMREEGKRSTVAEFNVFLRDVKGLFSSEHCPHSRFWRVRCDVDEMWMCFR